MSAPIPEDLQETSGKESQLAQPLREARERIAALEAQNRTLREDNLALRLLADEAKTYWHDGETEYEDPSEFSRENRLPVGHVFPLQAAAYWPVEFRVVKVDEDNDDYEVEQVADTRRAEYPEYFKLQVQNRQLREALTTLRSTMICQNYKHHMEMVDALLAATEPKP